MKMKWGNCFEQNVEMRIHIGRFSKARTKEAGFFDSHVRDLFSKLCNILKKEKQQKADTGVNDVSAHLGGEKFDRILELLLVGQLVEKTGQDHVRNLP